ncbi:helix-turn-helix domain-containing protein [Streptomyces sp. Qhu-G9]|uniref:helix-turn-helix domain-containing protein n=1 Tax=Streptomyces sp. Qhu-G9 TaxID=3452799 RepID=UPI0022ABE059|nr:transcriptional regulator [Streptomyces aurantiacus]WAU84222.1 helix-turn-helix domain-containing protein [Streptomyces aurantiacus]
MSTRDDDVEEFAALLRRLKARTDRSYGALARRVNMNTSTLHRYCAGDAVPLDFAPVERFATLCGATPAERLELHRLWILAVAARQRPRTPGPSAEPEPDTTVDDGPPEGDAPPESNGSPAGNGESKPRASAAAEPDESRPQPRTSAPDTAEPTEPEPATPGAAEPDGPRPGRSGRSESGLPSGPSPSRADDPRSSPPGKPVPSPSGEGTASSSPSRNPASGAAAAKAPGSPVPSSALGLVSTSGARPRSAWYRRRVTVTVAVVSALLASLGGLSALSGDRSSDDDDSRAVRPAPTTAAPDARHRPSTSPSPSGSGPSPSVSATPKTSEPSAKNGTPSGKAKPNGGGSVAVPLTWTANSQAWALGCGHDYVIRKEPQQVPPPPAAQDAGIWAATQKAVHGRETNVEISVQGRSSTAVVLTALRVRVVGRTAPVPGTVYAMDQGCGGSITPRSFAVDLDKDRPIARAVPGSDEGNPIPAVRMPYRVSAEDPEVLLVSARTQTCDCSWYLELDWSSEGRTGTVRIDDHGRPFRTSSIKGLPRYWYGTEGSERQWVPYDQ